MTYNPAVKFIDEAGVPYGVKHVNNKPRVSAMPYLYDIAEGNVTGHSPFSKYGRISGVTTATVDLWEVGGTYAFPPTYGAMLISSDSLLDASTGDGARKVVIDYLDSTYTAKTEEVTMVGSTPVTTAAVNILRVNRLFVSSVGSTGVAGGTISLKDTGGTITYSRITAGLTQSRQLIYTVPLGYNLYITSARFSVGVGNTTASAKFNYVTFTTKAKVNPDTGLASTIFYPYSETGLINAAFEMLLDMPTKIPEKADLKVSVYGDTALAVNCVAAVRGWIETI